MSRRSEGASLADFGVAWIVVSTDSSWPGIESSTSIEPSERMLAASGWTASREFGIRTPPLIPFDGRIDGRTQVLHQNRGRPHTCSVRRHAIPLDRRVAQPIRSRPVVGSCEGVTRYSQRLRMYSPWYADRD